MVTESEGEVGEGILHRVCEEVKKKKISNQSMAI